MIILRQKLYSDKSGRFWAGTKGALKGAGKGSLWGAALMPGKIRALRKDKYKLALGLTAAGATVGAGIGGFAGWKKGVSEYEYNQKKREIENNIGELKKTHRKELLEILSLLKLHEEFEKFGEFYNFLEKHDPSVIEDWNSLLWGYISTVNSFSIDLDCADEADILLGLEEKETLDVIEIQERYDDCFSRCEISYKNGWLINGKKSKFSDIKPAITGFIRNNWENQYWSFEGMMKNEDYHKNKFDIESLKKNWEKTIKLLKEYDQELIKITNRAL